MAEITDEEQAFWDKVCLKFAIYDILGQDTTDALEKCRVSRTDILKMAGEHCFLHPDELGVRRHYKRIRTLLRTLNETNVLEG